MSTKSHTRLLSGSDHITIDDLVDKRTQPPTSPSASPLSLSCFLQLSAARGVVPLFSKCTEKPRSAPCKIRLRSEVHLLCRVDELTLPRSALTTMVIGGVRNTGSVIDLLAKSPARASSPTVNAKLGGGSSAALHPPATSSRALGGRTASLTAMTAATGSHAVPALLLNICVSYLASLIALSADGRPRRSRCEAGPRRESSRECLAAVALQGPLLPLSL